MGMATTTRIDQIIKTEPATKVEEFVQPAELCDTQRRSMAYDAFAALQARGF
jgi:hypothetical protein